ncbi:MAG: SDR family oxidoreductase [Flavobacteriaceae bacterium]|nr:SDR family oxidoreductase [Flavobacteriaceae bacterium]
MNLFIIGASGGTGKQLVQQALGHGHQVTALVRNPKKFKIIHENLKVVNGDVLDSASFKDSMAGHDAVVSALGHKKFFIKTSILSRGTSTIITAMKANNIKRFLCITSLGINDSRFKLGLYYTLFVIPVILFFYFKDKEKQEQLIENSQLDWTIVRPVQLTNGKKRTNYKHGVTGIGHYIFTKLISRASVADFMLSQLSDSNYLYKKVGVSN